METPLLLLKKFSDFINRFNLIQTVFKGYLQRGKFMFLL